MSTSRKYSLSSEKDELQVAWAGTVFVYVGLGPSQRALGTKCSLVIGPKESSFPQNIHSSRFPCIGLSKANDDISTRHTVDQIGSRRLGTWHRGSVMEMGWLRRLIVSVPWAPPFPLVQRPDVA